MRIVIAMMKHETNTFSPVPTDWSRFEAWGAHFGEDARRAYENTAMPMAAYIALAAEAGATIVTPVAAEAMPSGIVDAEAYDRMADAICDAVAEGCDALLLDLHGAMVAKNTRDGEGTLLGRIRKIAKELPIAVTCDFHGNITQETIENCTALIGYKTYPHVDMAEVGRQVGRIVLDSVAGKCSPVMFHRKLPLLSHTLRQGTDDFPMKSLIRSCREAEALPGVLAVSIFGGFPPADMHDTGMSVVVVTDGDEALAQRIGNDIAGQVWRARENFIYRRRPLAEAVAEAREKRSYPVLLIDHEDNCGSGGTQDVMAVVREVIAQDLSDVAMAAIYDPAAVREMHRAGVGADVTVSLGGKTDMPSINLEGKPLEIRGRVRTLTDGRWTVRGPMYTGVEVRMGPTAVLDTGKVQLVVISRHHEPWDVGVFTSVGIRPEHKRYLLLKSRLHHRAGFSPIVKHTIHCDGEGVTTSNHALLDYQYLRRPVYPLDPVRNF